MAKENHTRGRQGKMNYTKARKQLTKFISEVIWS